jgi:hypothetical protein
MKRYGPARRANAYTGNVRGAYVKYSSRATHRTGAGTRPSAGAPQERRGGPARPLSLVHV